MYTVKFGYKDHGYDAFTFYNERNIAEFLVPDDKLLHEFTRL